MRPSCSVVLVALATAFSLLGDQTLYVVLPTYYSELDLIPYQVGLILSVLFQILLFFSSEPNNDLMLLDYLRLACLIFMVIIVGANYVENSRHLGFEFWSVIDLLVLLIFSGLVVLQLNGLDVAIWKWTEVILFYYSLGLYIQHRHPRAAVKSLGAVATG